MKYLTERSLFYYFLMREVVDAEADGWGFIAKNFGVKPRTVKTFECVLANPVLDELSTIGDVEMYKNYLNGFCKTNTEFGKSKCEQEAIDMKALALHKLQELFGDAPVRGNRLRSLSHNYGHDHIASVLYAMQMLYLNADKRCEKLAKDILSKEFNEGKNSDAGLILLNLGNADTAAAVARLSGLPDMLLRPDMLKYLALQYGAPSEILEDRRTIGF